MYHIPVTAVASLARLRTQLASRLASDRGDSPVPSAIIIAGLVILAVAVVTWIYLLGDGFMAEAPTDLPPPPGGGGD